MQQKTIQRSGRIALFVFGALLAGAAIWWRERMLFGDASWIVFNILNSGSLQIQEYRYGSFVTQAFPLIASWLHAPLGTVLFLYSLSFPLFFGTVALLLVRWKQPALAVLLAFYFTLTISVGYYWTNNEVHQGIAWMMLFFGAVLRAGEPGLRRPHVVAGVLLLAFLALFSHPLVILTTGAVWGFLVLLKQSPFGGRSGWRLALPVVGLAVLRFWISRQGGGYDSDHLDFISGLKFESVGQALGNQSSQEFLSRCWQRYYVLPILFGWGLIVLARQRRKGAVAWSLFTVFGFWTVLCLAFDRFTPWYSESDWAALSLIATVPFVLVALPRLRPGLAAAVLIAVFGIRLVQIVQAATPFEQREAALRQALKTMRARNCTKAAVLVKNRNQFESRYLLAWALPVEALFASSLEGERPQRTLAIVPDSGGRPLLRNTFRTGWSDMHVSELNPHYFRLDTNSFYVLFPESDLFPQ